jgi:hypothetical protein
MKLFKPICIAVLVLLLGRSAAFAALTSPPDLLVTVRARGAGIQFVLHALETAGNKARLACTFDQSSSGVGQRLWYAVNCDNNRVRAATVGQFPGEVGIQIYFGETRAQVEAAMSEFIDVVKGRSEVEIIRQMSGGQPWVFIKGSDSQFRRSRGQSP